MSILTGDNPFQDYLESLQEKKGPCWTGYKKVPSKKDYEEDSCVKEGDEGFDEYWDSLTEDEQIDYMEVAMECEGWDDLSEEAYDLDEASTVNGKVQTHKWKSTGLSHADAIAQHGKEKVRIGKFKRSDGSDDVQVHSKIDEDKKGHFRDTDDGAGLTQKGVDAYNRKTGGNLKTAVTTPPSKMDPDSKAAKRRKSFCARSRSWNGERGKAARRRWNC